MLKFELQYEWTPPQIFFFGHRVLQLFCHNIEGTHHIKGRIKQLLVLYFTITYSWQLLNGEKSLVGKKVHPYISRILQISFTQILFYLTNG